MKAFSPNTSGPTAPVQRFTFLSSLIGLPVFEEGSGRHLGGVADISASLRELYPKASGLMVKPARFRTKYLVPWKDVRRVDEGHGIHVAPWTGPSEPDARVPEGEFLLKDSFWDKQIVDISGSKVVRVNDLHMLREDLNLWLVHVDVGITGLMRRLGCESLYAWLADFLFSYKVKDRFISWKFVQPVASGRNAGLTLKVASSRLAELLPEDLAEILVDLGIDERIAILRSLDPAAAGGTFQELPMKVRVQMADLLDPGLLRSIVAEMETDETVDLVSQVSNKTKKALLSRMPAARVSEINRLLELSRKTAGSIMNTGFIAVRPTETMGAALERVKAEAREKESIYYVYAQDDNGALVGVVTLRKLLLSDPAMPVSQAMRKRVVRTRLDTNVRDVAEMFQKYGFTVAPVVDRQNRLQGIITMKDAFEAAYRELRPETERSA